MLKRDWLLKLHLQAYINRSQRLTASRLTRDAGIGKAVLRHFGCAIQTGLDKCGTRIRCGDAGVDARKRRIECRVQEA